MLNSAPTLHMFCGKIAAGKSTLAARRAADDGAVLIAEDDWLGALFSDRMKTGANYLPYASKLRAILGPHIVDLLKAGVSVVLDFQANTVESRAWMRSIFEDAGALHQLHVLVPPDDVCLARLRARNAAGKHPFSVTEAQYHRFTRNLVLPSEDEGFNVIIHDQTP